MKYGMITLEQVMEHLRPLSLRNGPLVIRGEATIKRLRRQLDQPVGRNAWLEVERQEQHQHQVWEQVGHPVWRQVQMQVWGPMLEQLEKDSASGMSGGTGGRRWVRARYDDA